MKYTIRKNTFETNSSSHHSLIITNEKDIEKDKEEFLNKEGDLWRPYGAFCEAIKSKEEKCYFLADLFNKEYESLKWMVDEYETFIQVLKDNKEEEILMNIMLYKEEFLKAPYDEPPFCQRFFFHGVLDECNCPFYTEFKKYFKSNSDKTLYEKIYDFIYKDGIIVPYECL